MNTPIAYVVTSDIVDVLAEFNAYVPTEIHVYKKSTSDVQDVWVESNTLEHDARCSISTPKIEEKTEHEIVSTNIATNEYLRFLPMVW